MQGLNYSSGDVEDWQGRNLNTAIPKDTTPLSRLLWSTTHFDYKKTFKVSVAFDLAYEHQKDDVDPTDGCQGDWSWLRQMAKKAGIPM